MSMYCTFIRVSLDRSSSFSVHIYTNTFYCKYLTQHLVTLLCCLQYIHITFYIPNIFYFYLSIPFFPVADYFQLYCIFFFFFVNTRNNICIYVCVQTQICICIIVVFFRLVRIHTELKLTKIEKNPNPHIHINSGNCSTTIVFAHT